MAAQARLRATGGVGDTNATDALADAAAVPLCLLHDLVSVAAFLASHPLHAAYVLFFARHLASLAGFFCPLLVSTGLLLAVLSTAGPYLGGAEWPAAGRSLGRTCGIAVAALCAELQPDGGGGAGLVAQLCAFVLGPGDAAAVDRVGEITGEFCDISGSCFLALEECKEPAFELPLIAERSFLDDENKDEVDDKVVISEDLKGSEPLPEQCCKSEARVVLQEMNAEEEHESVIQEQGFISSDMDGVSDVIVDKRLERDPVLVEIKKFEPVQAMELDVKKCEPVQAMELEIKKFNPAMEVKESEPVSCEPAKPRSSIAQRIKLWEVQVSGNFNNVIEDMEKISVKTKELKKCVHAEANPCVKPRDHKLKAQYVTSKKESVKQEHRQEFKDVKEFVPTVTEASNEIYGRELQAEEHALASHTETVPRDVEPEGESQEQECRAAQPEQGMQERRAAQPEKHLQEMEEYKGVPESPATRNERENSLNSTSIAGRVHSRISSENLVGEGSPSQKEKEWKRTLACKLYEERMQLKLRRDRAVVEGGDNMDLLWEAYEVCGSGNGVKQGGIKVKSSKKVEEMVEEEDEESAEHDDDDGGEGSVRQLCCLQALKFSTKNMGFGGGKPSLAKVSKVLKRMTVLSRVGSRRSQKG